MALDSTQPLVMLSPVQRLLKRSFDLSLSLCLMPCLLLPFLFFLILMSCSLNRWAWFSQTRIGLYGRPFTLYKLRTLKGAHHKLGSEGQSTTNLGAWLRKTHIDEWPQVFNILIGDMSFVGPRPDLPGYADQLQGEDRLILEVKPGLTGPASLKYRTETGILQSQKNPESYYRAVIWPDKVQMNKNYVKSYRFSLDLQLLLKTLVHVFN